MRHQSRGACPRFYLSPFSFEPDWINSFRFARRRCRRHTLWLGSRGAGFPAHLEIVGTRRLWLFFCRTLSLRKQARRLRKFGGVLLE